MPLSFRADWVLSLEVGEHVPPAHEMMYLRNLHAHACQGLVLSWAYLGKYGVGHVNTPRTVIFARKSCRWATCLTRATDFLRHSDRLKFNTHAELQQQRVLVMVLVEVWRSWDHSAVGKDALKSDSSRRAVSDCTVLLD